MLSVNPNTFIVRSASVLKPLAVGVPSTSDVEVTAVAVDAKDRSKLMSRLARVEDAVPVAVVVSPLAVSTNTPAKG